MFYLSLNIDHFATMRNARGGNDPDPVAAAILAEIAGATGIVAHLRSDRRHINEKDVVRLKDAISTKLNLEMSTDADIVKFACKLKPNVSTLVPEKPNELTTSGGLNVADNLEAIQKVAAKLQDADVKVSVFIEPNKKQLDAALAVGADIVEFNTLKFTQAFESGDREKMLKILQAHVDMADYAAENGLMVAAGHSLNYTNMREYCRVIDIEEYNIGHSIVARSMFIGLQSAVREMLDIIVRYKDFYD
jgi:pyridoxine 5-phosphate synthase